MERTIVSWKKLRTQQVGELWVSSAVIRSQNAIIKNKINIHFAFSERPDPHQLKFVQFFSTQPISNYFTLQGYIALNRSWDEINTNSNLSAVLGHCKNILPHPSQKNDSLIIDSNYYICCFDIFCPFSVRDWHWGDDNFHPY